MAVAYGPGRIVCWGLFFLFLAAPVFAGTATLTCTPPTLNTDGSPITGPLTFSFYWGQVSGGPYPNSATGVTVCGYVAENLADGDWYFVATAANEQGQESDWSNEALKTIATPPPVPAPPTNLTVQAGNLTAYTLSISRNRVVLVPVGTVPEGTPCDGSQRYNAAYVVPREAVSWAGSVQSQATFAICTPG